MNLMNKKVTHKLFGEGTIIHQNDSVVEINFATESKKFMYPDVFGHFLKLHDREDAKKLEELIELKVVHLQEIETQKEADRVQHHKKQKLRMEYDRLTNNHKLHNESQIVFSCDSEEQVHAFEEWSIYTGDIKTGVNKGKPNKGNRLHRNSAVLLTARDEKASEEERRILGIYMVKPDFIGKLAGDGNIPAHAKYKIQLTEQESEKMLFWQYYSIKNSPEKVSWGTGKYRYFNNLWTAQILRDVFEIKNDPAEKELVGQFLRYFCKLNQITLEELEMPTGVLARS